MALVLVVPNVGDATRRRKGEGVALTCRHLSVVMSATMEVQPRMGLMGTRSTPTIIEDMGICCTATCILPNRVRESGNRRVNQSPHTG